MRGRGGEEGGKNKKERKRKRGRKKGKRRKVKNNRYKDESDSHANGK